MGFTKKVKRSAKRAQKGASGSFELAGGALDDLARQLAKRGQKLDRETGRIEGLVDHAWDVTEEQLDRAIAEIEEFSQEVVDYLERLALELYLRAIRPFVDDANRIAAHAAADPRIGQLLLAVGNDLARGRYRKAAHQTLSAIGSPSSPGPLYAFCSQSRPFSTSLLITADVAVGRYGVDASGSVGLTVDLGPLDGRTDGPVKACVFVSEAGQVSRGGSSPLPQAGFAIGFVRGGPRSVGGEAIDLGVGSCNFGFPFAKELLGKPSLSSITVALAESPAPPLSSRVADWDVSVGASLSHIVQTIRGEDTGRFGPLDRSRLDGSRWCDTRGNMLRLRFTERDKKKNRDRFSLRINGRRTSRHIWKIDRYDKNDNNLNAYEDSGEQIGRGRISSDGNELVLEPPLPGARPRWYRYER